MTPKIGTEVMIVYSHLGLKHGRKGTIIAEDGGVYAVRLYPYGYMSTLIAGIDQWVEFGNVKNG